MLKINIATLFLSSLFLFSVSDKAQNTLQTFSAPSPTKTPLNEKYEGVENLALDSERVSTWCPVHQSASSECSEQQLNVSVRTFSKAAEKNNLNYYYEVSGGQIIGQGANVIWNFSEVAPGTYTITVGVGSDNKIFGKTFSKNIDVRECSCCYILCECPTINVSSDKKIVTKREIIEFKVNINGGTQDKVKYNWTIENGVIFEGQGTSKIKVQVLAGESVTAIVEIGGLCDTCMQTDSETVKISN